MNKTLAVFLLIVGLMLYVHAADVKVFVGGPNGENIFVPDIVNASVGDNIIFDWVSGLHSVHESDIERPCAKSTKPDAFTSGGSYIVPNKFIISAGVVGKTLFYCGVPGHCKEGMRGTLIITDPNSPPAPNPVSNPAKPTNPANPANPASTTPAAASSNDTGSNNTNNTPTMVGAIVGSLIGGSVLTIGGLFLYKKFKNEKIILVSGDQKNDYNLRQNQSQSHNYTTAYNNGQETIPISGNDDNSLRNYIVQVVKQEIIQDQRSSSTMRND